jgi:hypothetical protein
MRRHAATEHRIRTVIHRYHIQQYKRLIRNHVLVQSTRHAAERRKRGAILWRFRYIKVETKINFLLLFVTQRTNKFIRYLRYLTAGENENLGTRRRLAKVDGSSVRIAVHGL